MATSGSFLRSLGRNPASFTIALDKHPGAPLHCERVVRALPGKRYVCHANWQDRRVFAKLYFGPGFRRYWRQEIAGLQALAAQEIKCPQILHSGPADDGRAQVVLLEPIQPARSLHAAWWQNMDDDERLDMLETLMSIFARLHAGGLAQQDPHLNNFLISQQSIYMLDGGAISIQPNPLNQTQSLQNLGLFLATLNPEEPALLNEALNHYCEQRGWSSHELGASLQRFVMGFRRRRLNRLLKKIFRDCTAYACRHTFSRFSVYRRSHASPALERLLADPDSSLRQADARLLKDGNTCTVWSVPVDTRTLIVKRYNIKNLRHGFSRAWRKTRAAVSWKNAHRLEFYRIPTPTPIALIEERLGPLRQRGYFIMEAISGPNVAEFFTSHGMSGKDAERTFHGVAQLLGKLAKLRISHGDMKGSNIILTPEGPALIDLDVLQEHRWPLLFRHEHLRDMRRFQANWNDWPELQRRFAEALKKRDLPVAR